MHSPLASSASLDSLNGVLAASPKNAERDECDNVMTKLAAHNPASEHSSGDHVQPPSSGDNTQPPSSGDNTQPPSIGDNTQPPSSRSSTHVDGFGDIAEDVTQHVQSLNCMPAATSADQEERTEACGVNPVLVTAESQLKRNIHFSFADALLGDVSPEIMQDPCSTCDTPVLDKARNVRKKPTPYPKRPSAMEMEDQDDPPCPDSHLGDQRELCATPGSVALPATLSFLSPQRFGLRASASRCSRSKPSNSARASQVVRLSEMPAQLSHSVSSSEHSCRHSATSSSHPRHSRCLSCTSVDHAEQDSEPKRRKVALTEATASFSAATPTPRTSSAASRPFVHKLLHNVSQPIRKSPTALIAFGSRVSRRGTPLKAASSVAAETLPPRPASVSNHGHRASTPSKPPLNKPLTPYPASRQASRISRSSHAPLSALDSQPIPSSPSSRPSGLSARPSDSLWRVSEEAQNADAEHASDECIGEDSSSSCCVAGKEHQKVHNDRDGQSQSPTCSPFLFSAHVSNGKDVDQPESPAPVAANLVDVPTTVGDQPTAFSTPLSDVTPCTDAVNVDQHSSADVTYEARAPATDVVRAADDKPAGHEEEGTASPRSSTKRVPLVETSPVSSVDVAAQSTIDPQHHFQRSPAAETMLQIVGESISLHTTAQHDLLASSDLAEPQLACNQEAAFSLPSVGGALGTALDSTLQPHTAATRSDDALLAFNVADSESDPADRKRRRSLRPTQKNADILFSPSRRPRKKARVLEAAPALPPNPNVVVHSLEAFSATPRRSSRRPSSIKGAVDCVICSRGHSHTATSAQLPLGAADVSTIDTQQRAALRHDFPDPAVSPLVGNCSIAQDTTLQPQLVLVDSCADALTEQSPFPQPSLPPPEQDSTETIVLPESTVGDKPIPNDDVGAFEKAASAQSGPRSCDGATEAIPSSLAEPSFTNAAPETASSITTSKHPIRKPAKRGRKAAEMAPVIDTEIATESSAAVIADGERNVHPPSAHADDSRSNPIPNVLPSKAATRRQQRRIQVEAGVEASPLLEIVTDDSHVPQRDALPTRSNSRKKKTETRQPASEQAHSSSSQAMEQRTIVEAALAELDETRRMDSPGPRTRMTKGRKAVGAVEKPKNLKSRKANRAAAKVETALGTEEKGLVVSAAPDGTVGRRRLLRSADKHETNKPATALDDHTKTAPTNIAFRGMKTAEGNRPEPDSTLAKSRKGKKGSEVARTMCEERPTAIANVRTEGEAKTTWTDTSVALGDNLTKPTRYPTRRGNVAQPLPVLDAVIDSSMEAASANHVPNSSHAPYARKTRKEATAEQAVPPRISEGAACDAPRTRKRGAGHSEIEKPASINNAKTSAEILPAADFTHRKTRKPTFMSLTTPADGDESTIVLSKRVRSARSHAVVEEKQEANRLPIQQSSSTRKTDDKEWHSMLSTDHASDEKASGHRTRKQAAVVAQLRSTDDAAPPKELKSLDLPSVRVTRAASRQGRK